VLKTGYCLSSETAEKLLDCGDLDKLETLATVPIDRLAPMLEKIDLGHASRSELRATVKSWKLSPEEREKADEAAAKRAEHVKRLESPAGKIDAAAVLATKAVKDCELAARGQVNAELAMRAGFQLISAAVNTYEIKHDAFSDAVVEEFLACLSATAEFVKSVRGF
jgi:hypothetical protein